VFDVIVRPLFRPLFRSLFRGLTGAITKVLIDLSETAGAFYSLRTAFKPSGDFEVEFDFETTSATTTLMSGTLEVQNTIVIDVANSKLRTFAYVGGTLQSDFSSTANVNDGKLNTAKLTYVGTTVSLYLNGAIVNSGTWNLNGSQDILFFGNRVNRPTFNGIEADVKLTDLENSDKTLNFNLNNLTSNTELPSNVIVTEKIVNGDFPINVDDWVTTSSASKLWVSGTIELVGSLGPQGAYQAFATVIGEQYLAIATSVVASTAHLIRVGNGPVADAGIADSTETSVPTPHQVQFTATGTTSYVYLRLSTPGTVSWDNVSVKLQPNFVTYNNIGTGTSVRNTYTLSSDGTQLVSNLRTIDIAAQA
jgi:hypothetical protein